MSEEIKIETIVSKKLETNNTEKADSFVDKKMLYTVWGLMAAAFIPAIGLLAYISSVIVAYIQRGKTTNLIEKDNYTYAIKTFWWSLLWLSIGWITLVFIVGFFILGATSIWFIYRIIKGFLNAKSETIIYK